MLKVSYEYFRDEEVFLAQLHMRAELLNSAFLDKVVEITKSHVVLTQGEANLPNPNEAEKLICHDTKISAIYYCQFEQGPSAVEIHSAPIKTIARMREKLADYAPPHPRGTWPLCANILDPVRLSIVCQGPEHILEILHWFVDNEAVTGLTVCRVKNKFAATGDEVADGYRDLKLCVIFTGPLNLKIIGEIQIQDARMHEYKLKVR